MSDEFKPCEHVLDSDEEFGVVCTSCGWNIDAAPSDEVMDQARQQAFDEGGTDEGGYILDGDQFDEVVANACAAAVVDYALKSEDIRAELLADLQEAATTLRRYEVLHLAKGTEESTAKAKVNSELAARFEATIAKATA